MYDLCGYVCVCVCVCVSERERERVRERVRVSELELELELHVVESCVMIFQLLFHPWSFIYVVKYEV